MIGQPSLPQSPLSHLPSWYVIQDKNWLITKVVKIAVQFLSSYTSLNRNILHLHTTNIKWLSMSQVRSLNIHSFIGNENAQQLKDLLHFKQNELSFYQHNLITQLLFSQPPHTHTSNKSKPTPSENDLCSLSSTPTLTPSYQNNLSSSALKVTQKGKEIASTLRDTIEKRSTNIKGIYDTLDISIIEETYREMRELAFRFKEDLGVPSLDFDQTYARPFGSHIAPYYANIALYGPSEQYHTLQKSLFGLGNLLHSAPHILHDLRENLFLGNPQCYGKCEGINHMRNLTGQVVDLDTKAPSDTTETEMKLLATTLIDGFKELFKEFDFDKSNRHTLTTRNTTLNIPYTIPTAYCNNDRGRSGIWKYVAPNGTNSYYINIPDTHAVVDALILTPFLLAETWETIKATYQNDPIQLKKEQIALLKYFMEGGDYLGDGWEESGFLKCFNQKLETVSKVHKKWTASRTPKEKAIEAYGTEAVNQALTFNSLYGDGESLLYFFPQLIKHLKETTRFDLTLWPDTTPFSDKQKSTLDSAWTFACESYHLNKRLYQPSEEREFALLNKDQFEGLFKQYITYELAML